MIAYSIYHLAYQIRFEASPPPASISATPTAKHLVTGKVCR